MNLLGQSLLIQATAWWILFMGSMGAQDDPSLMISSFESHYTESSSSLPDRFEQRTEVEKVYQEPLKPDFQAILDSANLTGSILIFDLRSETYYSNDFGWAKKGQLPASTFKIANSIIALETGVVESDSTLFVWDGTPRALSAWEEDLYFVQAFRRSCVPCYQDVARRIGLERMKAFLEKLEYGKIIVDASNLDQFWLQGESKISPIEQIDFLTRFYTSQLPIETRTEELLKRIMLIEETENYKLSGKTGWSIQGDKNNGWFVGFLEKGTEVYFFATNVEPSPEFEMDNFGQIRGLVTRRALQKLNLIQD
ncbi:class D beta-lactamase [Algoriphagus namhaensis]